MNATQVRKHRLDTIARAIHHLDTAPRTAVLIQLTHTSFANLRPHLRGNPDAMAQLLRTITADTAPLFSAWKLAQKILLSAGLPHN
ncbi:hypothetical protein [Planomonospora sp. ID82291]|uniref:hypothetical protein n=1 Tax=Planomonospora sp. ID82291 TaxID=2738136 RepID=UPI0018C38FBC|nr:hypothetical protein [Planomonospora sp. ID82291]MBG0818706.1 hypothetical protein [Planomonospora sp. ID82291]